MNKTKNPKGAGRKRKFSTRDLLKIIDKYKQSGQMKGKISYSEIAKFGKNELGYEDLRYYHISNDNEVVKLIKEYNDSYTTFSGFFNERNNENSISNINVIEFVNSHYGNKQKLIMYLENYKKSYDMGIKEILKIDNENISLKRKLEELENTIDKQCKDINALKKENVILREDYKILSEKVEALGEQNLVDSLKSTDLVYEYKNENIKVNISELNNENGANLENYLKNFPELFSE